MSEGSAKRVLTYTALFAGSSILASPVVGASIGVALGATAIGSLFGNTLASDIHAAVTASSRNPLSTQHLQQLVGHALAALIECHEQEGKPGGFPGRLLSAFRRPDAELSALAKAARKHWSALQLTGEAMLLRESEVHRAFLASGTTADSPFISPSDWAELLTDLSVHARTWYGNPIWPSENSLYRLAEYIAPRFFSAVRELVKADLDPSVGTGGRVFIALHLDLMRAMSLSAQTSDASSAAALESINLLQQQLQALNTLVVDSLSRTQSQDVSDLVVGIEAGHRQIRREISQGFAEQGKQNDEVISTLRDVQASIKQIRRVPQASEEPLDHLISALKHAEETGDAKGMEVVQLSRAGRYDDAGKAACELAEAETALMKQLGQAEKDARDRAVRRWLDAGDIAFMSNIEDALGFFRRAVELNPLSPIGWSRIGQVSLWLGQHLAGLHAFYSAWSLTPEGIPLLLSAVDADAAKTRKETLQLEHPHVDDDTYRWAVRGVVVSGLNIIEILRAQPHLISELGMTLVSLDGRGDRFTPTANEAPAIIELLIERVYSLASVLGDGAGLVEHARLLETLSSIAVYRGDLDLGSAYLKRAQDMSAGSNDFVAQAVYLCNLGVIAGQLGQVNTARSYLEQAINICKGDATQPGLVVGKRLIPLADAERICLESERDLAAGVVSSKPISDDEIQVCNLLHEEFVRDTEKALPRALKLKETEGNARGNLGQIAVEVGEISLARDEYAKSLQIHESIGFAPGMAKTHLMLASLAMKAGGTQEACRHWDLARNLFVQMGMHSRAEDVMERMRSTWHAQ